jgi:Ser/Thr protein kinase RdoA (MazF antagonist)
MLFNEALDGWASWGRVFQSAPAFAPLIAEICRREKIPFAGAVENLTPGTNAVFKIGPFVVKIYAPAETGLATRKDFETELAAMERARSLGVRTPAVLAAGALQDRYLFRYLVLEHLPGREAGDALPALPEAERAAFVSRLRHLTARLHAAPVPEGLDGWRGRTAGSRRWSRFSPAFLLGREKLLAELDERPAVFVHGDLTGENLLIGADGGIAVLDFADALLAPEPYELPPVVFELFRGDAALTEAYMAPRPREEWLGDLLLGVLAHDFGGDMIEKYYRRRTDRECRALSAPEEFLALLEKSL